MTDKSLTLRRNEQRSELRLNHYRHPKAQNRHQANLTSSSPTTKRKRWHFWPSDGVKRRGQPAKIWGSGPIQPILGMSSWKWGFKPPYSPKNEIRGVYPPKSFNHVIPFPQVRSHVNKWFSGFIHVRAKMGPQNFSGGAVGFPQSNLGTLADFPIYPLVI